jgi:hypothetical protein
VFSIRASRAGTNEEVVLCICTSRPIRRRANKETIRKSFGFGELAARVGGIHPSGVHTMRILETIAGALTDC